MMGVITSTSRPGRPRALKERAIGLVTISAVWLGFLMLLSHLPGGPPLPQVLVSPNASRLNRRPRHSLQTLPNAPLLRDLFDRQLGWLTRRLLSPKAMVMAALCCAVAPNSTSAKSKPTARKAARNRNRPPHDPALLLKIGNNAIFVGRNARWGREGFLVHPAPAPPGSATSHSTRHTLCRADKSSVVGGPLQLPM